MDNLKTCDKRKAKELEKEIIEQLELPDYEEWKKYWNVQLNELMDRKIEKLNEIYNNASTDEVLPSSPAVRFEFENEFIGALMDANKEIFKNPKNRDVFFKYRNENKDSCEYLAANEVRIGINKKYHRQLLKNLGYDKKVEKLSQIKLNKSREFEKKLENAHPAYMCKSKLAFFVAMAEAEVDAFDYQLKKPVEAMETQEYTDQEHREYLMNKSKLDAYKEVRAKLKLEKDYLRFRMMCMDSQLSFIKNNNPNNYEYYADSKRNTLIWCMTNELGWDVAEDHGDYDEINNCITRSYEECDTIFKHGWSFTEVYENYSTPTKKFENEVVKKIISNLKKRKAI